MYSKNQSSVSGAQALPQSEDASYTTVSSLNLSYERFDRYYNRKYKKIEQFSEIIQALTNNKVLTHLYLNGRAFTVEDMQALAGLIEKSPSLIHLEMKNCFLSKRYYYSPGYSIPLLKYLNPLFESLKKNPRLKFLHLGGSGLADEEAYALMKALSTNTNLQTVHIAPCSRTHGSNQPGHVDYGPRIGYSLGISSLLSKNYTLLEFKIDDFWWEKDLRKHLKRNHQANLLIKSVLESEIQDVSGSINELIDLIPAAAEPEQKEDPESLLTMKECYRFLTAMGYATESRIEGNPKSVKQAIFAIKLLLTPFTNAFIQEKASLLCANFLFTQNLAIPRDLDFKSNVFIVHTLSKAECWNALVQNAFMKCCSYNHYSGNEIAFMSYKDLHSLAESALSAIFAKQDLLDLICEDETDFLEKLTENGNYEPEFLPFFVKSPAFVLAFRQQFPGKTSLYLLEDLLLSTPPTKIPDILVPIRSKDLSDLESITVSNKDPRASLEVLKEEICVLFTGVLSSSKQRFFGIKNNPTEDVVVENKEGLIQGSHP